MVIKLKFKIAKAIQDKMEDVYHAIEPKTKNHFHTVLQRELMDLAKDFKLYGVIEYRISEIEKFESKQGLIDVVWIDEKKRPVVSIEIDSGLRPKSMMKLISLNSEYKFYLYYGSQSMEKIKNFNEQYNLLNDVDLIYKKLKLGKNKDFGITKEHYR
jgi:hypothetical protein